MRVEVGQVLTHGSNLSIWGKIIVVAYLSDFDGFVVLEGALVYFLYKNYLECDWGVCEPS